MEVKRRCGLIKIIGSLFLFLVLMLTFILFTSPEKRLLRHEGSLVKVIGDVSSLKGNLKDIVFGNSQSTAGGKDLCRPDSPPGECYPPAGSFWAGPSDMHELKLDDRQVTDLVNEFKPNSLLTSDIRLIFEGDTAVVETTSFYPMAPGLIRAEIQATKRNYVVRKLYIGRIPAPESIRKTLENSLDSLIINSLSAYGVRYSSLEIRDGFLYVNVSAPLGLIQVDGNGELIINVEVLQQQDRYKVPEGSYRIM